ncbi:MAG: methyltransferase domain-containing protein [Nitrospirota bacterium]|nr:methyltransferase domain-containing protein [Nitrospirota bacterium]
MAHEHSDTPSPFLAEHIDLLRSAPQKTALDVACGKGRNLLYLASQGFKVTGVEYDDDAIGQVLAEVRKRDIEAYVTKSDLEAPGATLPGPFGVVCVFFFLYRPLLSAIRNAVLPGGFVVYETFLIDQRERWGSPRHAEFAWGKNELLHAFVDGFRVRHYEEVIREEARSATARIVAQKL